MSTKKPKEYIVVIEEYLSSVEIIDHLTIRLKLNQLEYILFTTLNDSPQKGVIFILTDGTTNYWLKQYEYHDFEAIRHKIGMEGTYDGYFEILKDAIKSNGVILSLSNGNSSATLNVKYQITKGVTLNGQFELGIGISSDKDPAGFKKINKRLLFELQSTLELERKENEAIIKEMKGDLERLRRQEAGESQKSGKGDLIGIKGDIGGFGKKESLKQKARTDLINPNRKKVKGKGAKFGMESVDMTSIKEI